MHQNDFPTLFERRNFLPIQLFSLRAFVKSVAAGCDFRTQNTPKCVCGRGFAMGSTGKAYSAPPDLLAGFQGPLRGTGCKGGGRKGEEGKGRKKGRGGQGGEHSPLVFTI